MMYTMTYVASVIGTGTEGAGGDGSCSPNKIIGGASYTSCSPNFFCNLQSEVTVQTVSLLLTQTFSKTHSFWGFAPDPLVHCIPFSKNTYCIKLYFEFDCLDCFSSPFFAPPRPNRKIVPSPMADVTSSVWL